MSLTAVTLENSRLHSTLSAKKIPSVCLPTTTPWNLLIQIRRLQKIIVQNNIDVIHVHHKRDLFLIACTKFLSSKKFRFVHTRQMEMPHKKSDPYHRFIYSQIDLLLCVTEKLTQEVRERVPMPAEKIQCLYYGVREPHTNEERIKEFLKKFPSTAVKIAMFSRIEEGKGQDKLIAALKKLKSANIPLKAYIFGHFMKPEYEKILHQKAKDAGVDSDIYWCGFQKDPVDLMPAFDVIVMPSQQETFGLVLIEAMAAKVVIMGSHSGGVPEIIDDGVTGYTFAPNNTDEFAEKLKILVSDPHKRQEMAQAGYEKYNALFSYEKHFKMLEDRLKNV